METAVNIDAFGKDTRIFLVISETDYDRMMDAWVRPDDALRNYFADMAEPYQQWSDVPPMQYRLLIIQTLEELIDDTDSMSVEQVEQLRFLITGMCLKVMLLTGDNVDLLRLRHLGNYRVNFEMVIDQTVAMSYEEEQPRPKLTVVVDNTKK
jgi:hypothetical protein